MDYAAFHGLTHGNVERESYGIQPQGPQSIVVHGRAGGLPYGRKLSFVTDEKHPAAGSGIDMADKMGEERASAAGTVGDERSLVDDEKGVAQLVGSEEEGGVARIDGIAAV